jgi:hypothetical protein
MIVYKFHIEVEMEDGSKCSVWSVGPSEISALVSVTNYLGYDDIKDIRVESREELFAFHCDPDKPFTFVDYEGNCN